MNKEEFVRRWRYYLTGLAVYGTVVESDGNALRRAARIHEIPAEVELLLAKMWADLQKPDPKPEPAPEPSKGPRK